MATISLSVSTPDLSNTHRVKRKPVPVDTPRYPPPDPDDPFAPLWVLRNRSSSIGPLNASSTSLAAILAPPTQSGKSHYLPYSQRHHFPRLASPDSSQTNVSLFRPASTLMLSPTSDENSGSDSDSSRPVAKLRKKRGTGSQTRLTRFLAHKTSSLFDRGEPFQETPPEPAARPVTWEPWTNRTDDTKEDALLSLDHYNPFGPPCDILPDPMDDIRVPTIRSLRRRKYSTAGHPFPYKSQSLSSGSFINISAPSPSPSCTNNSSEDASILPRCAPQTAGSNLRSETGCGSVLLPPLGKSIPLSDDWPLPSQAQLVLAASLPVVSQDGACIPFGALFARRKTVVVFIRHFWCPASQDYMFSICSALPTPESLSFRCSNTARNGRKETQKHGRVRFVVVGNGGHAMIPKYRQIFGLHSDLELFTDPSLKLYQALGMDKEGTKTLPGAAGLEKADCKTKAPGKRKAFGGFAKLVVRAIKFSLPVWEKGGDVQQLGGEFIFGPGLQCTFAHRMKHTKDHLAIGRVLQAAGILQDHLAHLDDAHTISLDDSLDAYQPDFTSQPLTIDFEEHEKRKEMARTRTRSVLRKRPPTHRLKSMRVEVEVVKDSATEPRPVVFPNHGSYRGQLLQDDANPFEVVGSRSSPRWRENHGDELGRRYSMYPRLQSSSDSGTLSAASVFPSQAHMHSQTLSHRIASKAPVISNGEDRFMFGRHHSMERLRERKSLRRKGGGAASSSGHGDWDGCGQDAVSGYGAGSLAPTPAPLPNMATGDNDITSLAPSGDPLCAELQCSADVDPSDSGCEQGKE